ncbi:MAG: T9SS type A sorting domain-containing protein [Hymenobacter sp.]|nr:MAG: T9SS type A sorting domain-containing protein [Hymenobacter sp.]
MKYMFTRLGRRELVLAAALALPGLAAAQQQQKTAPAAALSTFAARAKAQGLKTADVSNPFVSDSYTDTNGLTHTYLQQRVNGLVVHNATGAVHTDATGKVVLSSQFFLADAAQKAPSATPALTAEQAVTAATIALGLPRPVGLQRVTEARPADGLVFNNGGISEENIPVRLMYEKVDGQLVLVWGVTIAALDQQHYWYARVNAQTGRLVSKDDYTNSETTTFRQHAIAAQLRRQQSLAFAEASVRDVRQVASPLQTTAANSLTVVAVPGEDPIQAPRTVVPLSSANHTYSPYGWQVGETLAPSGFFADSYTLATASGGKQLTRGNNVAAYDDNATTTSGNGNASSTTNSPDGGPTLNFDFPFVQANGARDANNLAASITNLFYWNNINHDVQMAHGFDEVSGNFQYKNLTGAGLGGDFVRAEAQDGSGRNNANFSTPNDGSSGRMQMYLFDNVAPSYLTITGAPAANGQYLFAPVGFGPSLTKKPLAGKLVLVNDGVSADGGDHGCYNYVNAAAVAGNIAFIQRGGCPQLTVSPRTTNAFATKVKRAQANGATGVIVFDSLGTTTTLTNFTGTDTVGIRIPAIFISGADGFKLRAAMLAGSTLNGSAALGTVLADLDGSFDSGVMSHEFGHGVSNRLTGGPANSSCLNSTTGNQTMGEGWSDFFGLWITTKPGDIGSTPRYIGTYVNGNPSATGPGFRHKPYTTNMSLNNYTYSQLGTGAGQYSETHDVGEVWATVLWDLNWQFIYKYGYNSNFYTTTGGNNMALKLVLDGCKLQVCNPGFLDGRDAILKADSLNNRGSNASLIWAVFARRGMGYSATQGPRTGAGGAPLAAGSTAAFDVPPRATPIVLSTSAAVAGSSALEAFPNPAQDLLTVRTQLSSGAPMQVTVMDLMGKQVLEPTAVPVARMQQTGVELNTSRLAAGIYVVRVTTTEGTFTTKVTIQH